MIVLIMHGMPPKDFPVDEKREFMRLHAQYDHQGSSDDPLKVRHDELDLKMRKWPRTEENDAFHKASYEIAEAMKKESGQDVIVGFNEFCAPSAEEALDQAAATGAKEVVVITPMVTRGGSHAEFEIPEIVEEAGKRHPNVHFSYAWPFEADFTAKFLCEQASRFSSKV